MKCRYCAEEIQDKAIRCKHCGRNLKISALTFIGNGWAILGVINIFLGLNTSMAGMTLLISLVIFIIPGLTMAHIGKK